MHQAAEPAPEFSRIVRADAVHRGEVVETIEATEAERKALAERFELEAIGSLRATLRLRSVRGGKMVRVTGELEAEVVQTCVLTLDPVPARVAESFGALFAPESLIPKPEDEIDIDPFLSDEDSPEPMSNGRIDIGELTAQHLSLALDPYPQAEGAAFPGFSEDSGEEAEGEEEGPAAAAGVPNPFAALERLKHRN